MSVSSSDAQTDLHVDVDLAVDVHIGKQWHDHVNIPYYSHLNPQEDRCSFH